MKVCVVVSNGDEVRGQIEGVFTTYKDAKKCYNKVKEDWLKYYSKEDIEEQNENVNSFELVTFDDTLEVKIETVEVK